MALESTRHLFSVPTHNKADLKGVIDEKVRQKARSSGAGQKASLVLNPTIETISFGERRRLAPMNRGKDAVSAEGQVSMTVQVLNVSDGSVATRMQIDAPYHGPERLADPLANDPLAARGTNVNTAVHGARPRPRNGAPSIRRPAASSPSGCWIRSARRWSPSARTTNSI